MEYTKVNEQLKYVAASGSTLSCEERMQLEYAMSTLQSSMCFETLFFWGKISGKYLAGLRHFWFSNRFVFLGQESKPTTMSLSAKTLLAQRTSLSVSSTGASRRHGSSASYRLPRCNSHRFSSSFRQCSLERSRGRSSTAKVSQIR